MAFSADIRQFRTAADLAAFLSTKPRPDWPNASTVHNTYRPTEAQWVGLASMNSMMRGYKAKGWSSGPHYYLALGSPIPKNDGIWQLTPPTQPGTHAGDCNDDHFGVELVGDFQSRPPSLPQQQLLVDALVALHRWAGLGATIDAHRDCMAHRTCPGDALYALMPTIRSRVAQRLAQAGLYVARHTQAIFESPTPDGKVALNDTARLVEGVQVDIDEVKQGWAHLASGLGFVPVGVLSRLSS